MECLARRDAVDDFDAADLDQAVAVKRVKTGRFGIEHDFAHETLSCRWRRRLGRIRRRQSSDACPRAFSTRTMSRTCARASLEPCELSTTKSARRRFSRPASAARATQRTCSSVIPGRPRTRARCTSAAPIPPRRRRSARSPPVSNSSGTSSTTTRRAAGLRLARKASRACRDQRMHDGLELRQRRGIAEHASRASFARSTLPPSCVRERRSSINGAASPA